MYLFLSILQASEEPVAIESDRDHNPITIILP